MYVNAEIITIISRNRRLGMSSLTRMLCLPIDSPRIKEADDMACVRKSRVAPLTNCCSLSFRHN
jgi:hypothetical protein